MMQYLILFIVGLILACWLFPGAILLITMLLQALAELFKLLTIVFILLVVIAVFTS